MDRKYKVTSQKKNNCSQCASLKQRSLHTHTNTHTKNSTTLKQKDIIVPGEILLSLCAMLLKPALALPSHGSSFHALFTQLSCESEHQEETPVDFYLDNGPGTAAIVLAFQVMTDPLEIHFNL